MSDSDQIKLLCKNCGQVFYAFLRQMAEHNAKVICPHCGKAYSLEEALKMARANPQGSDRSGQD